MHTSSIKILSLEGQRRIKSSLGFLCIILAILAGMSTLGATFGYFDEIFTRPYLSPWIIMLILVLMVPLFYLFVTNRFNLFHPLVYPVWSYLFPAYVLGSLYVVVSNSEPSVIHLIPDQEYYIPLAMVYVAVGFTGLTVGYSLRIGRRLGERLSHRLPVWNWELDQVIVPCLILIVIGRFFELEALAIGAIGYQITEEPTSFGVTYFFLTILVSMSNIILWLVIFKAQRFRLRHFLVATFLIGLIPYTMLISGGKGELLRNAISILFAYWSSGRRITVGKGIIAAAILAFAVLAGVIYGTAFRQLKGDESRIAIGDYLKLGTSTLSDIKEMKISNAGFVIENVFLRFETLTSLAVIVGNYQKLHPLEAEYGIENNIWASTWTALIPRFFWSGKPDVSPARAMTELYFNVEGTSAPITPMGDLLRNFGPFGVPFGMAFLGIILRVLYSSIIECGEVTPWKSACYFMLLSHISYEGFYSGIFPVLLRTSIILLLGGIIINTLISISIIGRDIK